MNWDVNLHPSKFLFLTRNPLSIANSYKNRWLNKFSSDYFLYRVSVIIKTYFLSYLDYYNEKKNNTSKIWGCN